MSHAAQICQMLHWSINASILYQVLHKYAICCTSLSYAIQIYQMLPNSFMWCTTAEQHMLNDSIRTAQLIAASPICQLLNNSVRCRTTLSDAVQIFLLLHNSVWCCTNLSDAAQLCQILHNSVRYCATMSDTALQVNAAQLCQVLNISVRYWKTLFYALQLYQTTLSDTERFFLIFHNFVKCCRTLFRFCMTPPVHKKMCHVGGVFVSAYCA